jgi:SAM-dependent methyltransferase
MSTDLQQWFAGDAQLFLRAVGLFPGAVLLDFGCRRGSYAIPAARLVGPGGRVYAVDKDADALSELGQLAAASGLANIACINTQGDVRVPLADGVVDVVLLYDVIHLIGWRDGDGGVRRRSTAADRRRLFEEMCRIARPGALLSVHIRHLDTHTDAESEDEIRGEIERCGFRFRGRLERDLIHDEKWVSGHVINFTRMRRDVSRRRRDEPRFLSDDGLRHPRVMEGDR